MPGVFGCELFLPGPRKLFACGSRMQYTVPMRHQAKSCIGFLILVCFLLLNSSFAGAKAVPVVTVLVTLDGDPAANPAPPNALSVLQTSVAKARLRGQSIKAQHDALEPKVAALGGKIVSRFSRLANAVKVRIPANKMKDLETLPGVRKVSFAHRYSHRTETSVPFIGATQVWGTGFGHADGTGVRIGIIDTGIDYTHADFGGSGKKEDYTKNDPGRIEPGTFPTAKVVGGYDFVGDDYDPDDPAHAVPLPDPDPLDLEGHGTHVAGIAAGFGVLTNGQTYTGPYSQSLDYTQLSIGPGVAPNALLYALKVFGKGVTEYIFDALEWAADPNGDFDFSDHLDVVNLSLGEDFGLPTDEDTELAMINRLSALGCVVAIACGNGGNTFYIAGSPAIASSAITVASSRDNGITSSAIEVISPSAVAGEYQAQEGAFTKPLEETGPVEAEVVYVEPHDACDDLTNSSEINGRIALIDRGTCFFVDKIQKAQDAGAIGVVMVNNVPGDPIVMGGDNPNIVIPGMMITKADGALLKNQLANHLVIRLAASVVTPHPELADTLSDFSSRGPSAANVLKPDIAAPGDTIRSARAGSGSEAVIFSGTSMATPTIAGSAALLKQLHPDWPVEDIKAALMNTAVTTKDLDGNLYPESLTGAGRVQVDAAAKTSLTAAADNAQGLVSLSFGDLELTEASNVTRQVRIKNHTSTDIHCDIAISNTIVQGGIALRSTEAAITVPAGGSVLAQFELSADPGQFDLSLDAMTPTTINGEARHFLYEASGEIYFRSTSDAIHLPYHASLRACSSFNAAANLLQVKGGATAVANPRIDVPLKGFSTTADAMCSVFQLGYVSPSRGITDLVRASGDLLAIGAASDIASAGTIDDTTLYFGLATAGSWATPQPSYVKFEVMIDTNLDGVGDFTLYNGPDYLYVSGGDVFYSVLDGPGRLNGEITGYLNVFPPDEVPLPLFNNSVMFLSVPAAKLGLSASSSQFRYSVQSVTRAFASDNFKYLVDVTPWVNFDAAHPIVDGTAGGKDHTPLLSDGRSISLNLDLQSAADARTPEPALMILHHYNSPSNRLDVVRLDLSNSDSDNDGLPDWWENKYFGNLTSGSATGDFDHDGASDLEEFRAGTDPADAKSRFQISALWGEDGYPALSWPGASGRVYTIERTSDLNEPFTDLGQLITATPPVNTFEDISADSAGPYFYRVRIAP